MSPPPSSAGMHTVRRAAPDAGAGDTAGSVPVPAGPTWKRLAAFVGPGYLVAVGYMDPGNWATGIAAGSAFGYQLLFVVLLSNLVAMALQSLATKLGIVTGMDLAQACRHRYSPAARTGLWVLCELAIVACDLAEVLGTAVALQLLFGVPLGLGVFLSAVSVFVVMALEQRGFRKLEALIVGLIVAVAACLAIELLLSQPSLPAIASGLLPDARLITDPAMLYVAIGIVGATVMPHNLYLHSSIVQTRRYRRDLAGMREAIRFASIDSVVALGLALFVNAAILILAASTFHACGRSDVAELSDAYQLLTPTLGVGFASTIFGIALLASGQNATITGSVAGQIVMEGFTRLRIPLWKRRLIARAAAIIPACGIATLYGEQGVGKLLILSQVVLSAQLPFAAIPLLRMCNDRRLMGDFVNEPIARPLLWACVALIVALNAKLVLDTLLSSGVYVASLQAR